MDLVDRIYDLTQKYPDEERFGLRSESRESARSVAYNIAEGKMRISPNEFRHFIGISLGSLGELQTQVLIAGRRKYLTSAEVEATETMIEEIGRMSRGLERALA